MALRGGLALKILIGSAIGVVVGFGTCGLAAAAAGGAPTQDRVQSFLILGLVLFVASLVALVVSGIWLLVAVIVGGMRR
jgi:hypothetical protein